MLDQKTQKSEPRPIAHSRLGESLVRAGAITEEQLETALGIQAQAEDPKPRLGSIIAREEFASEEAIAHALADLLGLSYIDLAEADTDFELTQVLPQRLAHKHQVVAVEMAEDRLVLAVADPTNLTAVDDVKTATGIGRVELRVASIGAVRTAIEQLYAVDMAAVDALDRLGISSEVEFVADDIEDDPDTLERDAQTGPVIRLVNALLGDALRGRATDVHIEARTDEVKVRYRIDGLLRDVMTLPKHVLPSVVSRIKIISGMDISERRRPQDGRNKFVIEGRAIDTRVSTMPTVFGEKVVVRLLHKHENSIDLSTLGLTAEQAVLLKDHLDMPQGLLVFTGPTGAGKSSTMYAAMSKLSSEERNLVSLEDPVEFQIPGLNQIQINERSGITFARGLRSVLRQDPDVIMVGEIRDVETAQMVMQASFTGHMVLSSLHTRDAPGALTRLADLGVEPFRIAAAVTLVVAQRLVRLVCEKCAGPVETDQRLLAKLGLSPADAAGSTFLKGSGCEACAHTGYRGRTGIFEVFPVTPAVREQLGNSVSESAMARAARGAGMTTLLEHGIQKARAGLTTLEEVHRVLYIERVDGLRCPSCQRHVASAFVVCPYCRADLTDRPSDPPASLKVVGDGVEP